MVLNLIIIRREVIILNILSYLWDAKSVFRQCLMMIFVFFQRSKKKKKRLSHKVASGYCIFLTKTKAVLERSTTCPPSVVTSTPTMQRGNWSLFWAGPWSVKNMNGTMGTAEHWSTPQVSQIPIWRGVLAEIVHHWFERLDVVWLLGASFIGDPGTTAAAS